MSSIPEALGLALAMGAVILFCRAFPFLFFSGDKEKAIKKGEVPEPGKKKPSSRGAAFLNFVEKTVPPAAMTVLTFNALGGAFLENSHDGLLAFAAAMVTALLHLWKRNSLVSIFGGTALYMVLLRVLPF